MTGKFRDFTAIEVLQTGESAAHEQLLQSAHAMGRVAATIDARFAAIEQRFAAIEARLKALEEKPRKRK
jgi:hypothetical protein